MNPREMGSFWWWRMMKHICLRSVVVLLVALAAAKILSSPVHAVGIEQQINIINQEYYSDSTSTAFSSNNLGLVRWTSGSYTGATVYFEVVMKVGGVAGSTATAQLWAETGFSAVTEVTTTSTTFTRVRSGAITLTNNTNYLVRFKNSSGGGGGKWSAIKSARLIIVQSSGTSLTNTETQVELGSTEGTSGTSYATLDRKKIYRYDSSKFTPAPSAYFEATFRASYPKLEQQINIIDQEFVTGSPSNAPTDNSLGLFRWNSSVYTSATVYFEAVAKISGASSSFVVLTDSSGNEVASSGLAHNRSLYERLRSGAITLTNGTDYTVRARTSIGSLVYLKAARLIIVQSNATRLTDTETQVEIGDAERTYSSSYTSPTDKKIYYYDSSKFTPAPTAYFEAGIAGENARLEQQINIVDQTFTTTSSTDAPTDNSLGLFRWTAGSYTSATVYLEAVVSRSGGSSSNTSTATLYDSAGTAVSGSAVSTTSTTYNRVRSGSITLTDGTNYTVRIKRSGTTTARIKAARLIIAQSNSTKITDTETAIELGNNQGSFTNTTYSDLTDFKIYLYDKDKFSPAPETSPGDVKFHASLKIADSADSVEAELFNRTDSLQVTQLTHTGDTNWTLKLATNVDGDADWDTVNDDQYSVRIKCTDNNGGGCSGSISNAKLILYQSASGGITVTELVHEYLTALATDTDSTYTSQTFSNFFPTLRFGVQPTVYYEATMKTSAGTGYTQIIDTWQATAIGSSEISTTGTTYSRVRTSSNIFSGLNQLSGQEIDVQMKNSASNTTSVATSWLIIQLSSIPTSTGAGAAQLYDETAAAAVSGSEVTETAGTFSRVRSASITLVSGHEYSVQFKSSLVGDAKLILNQTAAGGISAVELIHQEVNSLATDSDTTYTDLDGLNQFEINNFGVFPTIYYEATMKTASSTTGYVQLTDNFVSIFSTESYNTIAESEITTTSTTYTRVPQVRGGNLTYNLYPVGVVPFGDQDLETQAKNSASSTTSVASSWIIIQLANIPTSGGTGYVQLYQESGTPAAVSGSEISTTSGTHTRVRSSSFSLATDQDYVVQVKSSILVTAKLVLIQSDTGGISAVELVHQQVNKLVTDTDTTYTDQEFDNQFDPANFASGTFAYLYEAALKSSAGTGYAILENDTDTDQINNPNTSEVTNTTTSYARARSSAIGGNTDWPSSAKTMDTQLKNSATNTTSVTSSTLIVQASGLPLLNANPNTPASLGPSSFVNGSWTNDTTPAFDFTLSDSDSSDTLKFRIQVDDTSDFSSVLVDYTSALAAQGARTFTVGQAAGSGSYTTGSSGQILSDSDFYWRVKAIDNSSAESSYATANSGAIAFKVDTTAPLAFDLISPGDQAYLNEERPTFKWKGTTDARSGMGSYRLEVDNGDTGDFTISGIPVSRTSDYVTNTYIAHYEGFGTSSATDDYVSVYTKSSSDWSSSQNDGKTKEGKRNWSVKAIDMASNERSESRAFFLDRTSPTSSIDTIDDVVVRRTVVTVENQLPTLAGTITDNLVGDATYRYVAAGPAQVELKFETIGKRGRNSTYTFYSIATIPFSITYWSSDGTKITDNTLQTSNKFASYSYRPTRALPLGDYRVTISGKDSAGNIGTTTLTVTVKAASGITKIFGVRAINIATNSALIIWQTNHLATSKVNYGLTPDYGDDASADTLVRNHALALTNLIANTLYYYEVMSQGRTYAFDARHEFTTLALTTLPVATPLPTPAATELPLATSLPEAIASAAADIINDIIDTIGNLIKPIIAPLIEAITALVTVISETLETIGESLNANPVTSGFGDAASTATTVGVVTISAALIVSATLTAVGMAVAASHHVGTTTVVTTTGLTVTRFHAFLAGLSQGISHVLTTLLTALGLIKRKRRTVGIVFDAASRQPIAGAFVVFYSSSGNLRSVVTNQEGRFLILAPPDTYTVRVEKPGYLFPSTIVTVPSNDLFSRIYRKGEEIVITGEPLSNLAIPLDPTSGRVNILLRLFSKVRNSVTYLIVTLALPIILASLLIVIYANLTHPTFINRIALIMTGGSLIYYIKSLITKTRTWGTVTADGKPLPALTMELNRELPERTELYAVTTTDREGRYLFTPDNGTYHLKVFNKDRNLLTERSSLVVNEDRPLVNVKLVVENS